MKKKLFCLLLSLFLLFSSLTGCNYKDIFNSNSYKNRTFSNRDIIYFIMTDRFCNGDTSNDYNVNKNDPFSYHGGDFKGIISKLDYIKSLGTTAIWITPVVENEDKGYHGYWAKDFTKVDPHLGSMDDLKNLVKEAHKRDIKVIVDYVVNHTGHNSPYLTDGKHEGWFHPKMDISNYDDPKECENGWLSNLPDLNQENPKVKKFLINNALWWIKETKIDGMRLDTVKHVPKSFWREFTKAIKEKYPNFYFLGEVWSGNPVFLEQYNECGIDGLTDYPLYYGIKSTFKPLGLTDGLISAIQQRDTYLKPELNGIFIDNHDNKRFITDISENKEDYLKLALSFIMTYPSIPVIYYGTEIAMEGDSDPDNRRDMEWDKTSNSNILNFYKKLTEIKNSNSAFASNNFKLLNYDSNFLSYSRWDNKNNIVVVMNVQDTNYKISVDTQQNDGEYTDLLTNKTYKSESGKLNFELKPFEFLILKKAN
ncbi:MAG: alpha-amylase family glycosyl hydrolase [Caloramator sp.]|nr:alpha-amylase family glycosyl hydrolase [Caloramator sp.]